MVNDGDVIFFKSRPPLSLSLSHTHTLSLALSLALSFSLHTLSFSLSDGRFAIDPLPPPPLPSEEGTTQQIYLKAKTRIWP